MFCVNNSIQQAFSIFSHPSHFLFFAFLTYLFLNCSDGKCWSQTKEFSSPRCKHNHIDNIKRRQRNEEWKRHESLKKMKLNIPVVDKSAAVHTWMKWRGKIGRKLSELVDVMEKCLADRIRKILKNWQKKNFETYDNIVRRSRN